MELYFQSCVRLCVCANDESGNACRGGTLYVCTERRRARWLVSVDINVGGFIWPQSLYFTTSLYATANATIARRGLTGTTFFFFFCTTPKTFALTADTPTHIHTNNVENLRQAMPVELPCMPIALIYRKQRGCREKHNFCGE